MYEYFIFASIKAIECFIYYNVYGSSIRHVLNFYFDSYKEKGPVINFIFVCFTDGIANEGINFLCQFHMTLYVYNGGSSS